MTWSFVDCPPDPSLNVEILSVNKDFPDRDNWVYDIRHLCCGLEAQVKHKALQRRVRLGVSSCPKCAAKRGKSRGKQTKKEVRPHLRNVLRKEWPIRHASWPVPQGSQQMAGDDRA